MDNLSFDLLLGLIVALFFLYQYVMQQIRARKRRQGMPEGLPHVPRVPNSASSWEWVVPAPIPAAATVMPPTSPVLEHRTERHQARSMRPRQRFSRGALLGNRHKLQDAVVIAAVMGPCRAVEPHDLR
jgi:hypothetical protein